MLLGLALLLLLVGAFAMVVGYQMVYDDCLKTGGSWHVCWSLPTSGGGIIIGLRGQGVGIFYMGVAFAIMGTLTLMISEGGRILEKLRKPE